MLDYGSIFSIIHRYGRILLEGDNDEQVISGRIIPYMELITGNPGISQDFIAKRLKIDKGNVARTLKLMENEGMVERRPGATDKRCYEIYPTEKLLGMNRSCVKKMEKFYGVILDGISSEDMEVFDKVLLKMSENIVASVSEDRVKEYETNMKKKGDEH